MSESVKAMCLACNTRSQLSQEEVEQLEKSEPVTCAGCGAMVRIKPDPDSERKAKISVLTLTFGALIVGIVALVNIVGDAGFPTYAVAIPYALIFAMMAASQSDNDLQLQRADKEE